MVEFCNKQALALFAALELGHVPGQPFETHDASGRVELGLCRFLKPQCLTVRTNKTEFG